MQQVIVFKRSITADWKLAEIDANAWFLKHGLDSIYMDLIKKNYQGFDLLVEEKYRINVKYANHTKRSENEYLFKTNKKKHGVKTTDYYLFMFKDLDVVSNTYKYRAYLVPYEDIAFSNTITITKTRLARWEKYKLTKSNLENLGITKTEKVA
ncbi:hypothetical protein FG877_02115 [Enterococcus casseliflavus]|nr:hypothetical protein [Enterococcus casseliflavus]